MRFITNIQIICKLQPNFLKPQGVMKNLIYILFLALVISACADDTYQDQNLIPDITFNTSINLNLPESQDLLIPNGYVIYPSLGHRGIIVFNTGNGEQSVDQFLAFDLACPHIDVTSCGNPMDISGFPELKNSCSTDGIFYRFDLGYSITYLKDTEGNTISIPEGDPVYDLQQYKVDQTGPKELRISNF